MLTIGDGFAGAGGSSTGAAAVPGVTVAWALNHWAHAVEVHNANHPDALHDCFAAGTMILTSTGMTPIEDVQPGQLVLTHKGRWRRVVRKFEKRDRTVVMRSALHAAGIEVTPNHEFWTRRTTLRSKNCDYVREYAPPKWQPIENAVIDRVRRDGRSRDMIALPATFGELPWEEAPEAFGADPESAWWLIGRWLGDGSSGTRNGDITICCGRHEIDHLVTRVPDHWRGRSTSTAYVFYDYDQKTARWLRENFGSGAAAKQIPGWALTMPEANRRALLAGYVSADGSRRNGVTRTTSVSKALALGIRMLAHSLGYKASLHYKDHGATCVIQGRTVSRLPLWSVHWVERPVRQNTMTDELHCWVYVQGIEPAQEDVPVYTMEVAEDHSYIADGLVVKNCVDISQCDPRRYPAVDLLWMSPECTNHSVAKGRRRDLDRQPDLFGEILPDEAAERSRSTMWDVLRFVEASILRGRPIRGLVVENVVDVHHWIFFEAWRTGLRNAGYCLHEVSLNSMHAPSAILGRVPQSRDRWYMVGHRTGDPCPNLRDRLAPPAHCPDHGLVDAVQAWKNGRSWGRYRAQYVYRCPTPGCARIVEPHVLPAAHAIDWSLPGQRIGDRTKPLADKTIARIAAGIERYWTTPQLVPAGGTWRDGATPTTVPMPTRTTRENDGLLVPVEGRDGKTASSTSEPLRTCTTRNETGIAIPFVAELRGGGSKHRPVTDPLATVCANGNHHGVVTRDDPALLVPYYGNGTPRPVSEPAPTVTTVDRASLIQAGPLPAVEDCLFRMLTPQEYAAAMAFPQDYIWLGNKRERVRLAGNAVTPPAAEVLVSALVEAITGETLAA